MGWLQGGMRSRKEAVRPGGKIMRRASMPRGQCEWRLADGHGEANLSVVLEELERRRPPSAPRSRAPPQADLPEQPTPQRDHDVLNRVPPSLHHLESLIVIEVIDSRRVLCRTTTARRCPSLRFPSHLPPHRRRCPRCECTVNGFVSPHTGCWVGLCAARPVGTQGLCRRAHDRRTGMNDSPSCL